LEKRADDRLKDAAALLAALDALGELRPIATPPPVLSGEQQLLSVLMATPPSGLSPAASDDATRTLRFDARELRELEDHGARLEVLADGSLVVTLLHTGVAATDQATRAAQCAMLIKSRWPEARVALGTGAGLRHDRTVAGEAFDRTAAL